MRRGRQPSGFALSPRAKHCPFAGGNFKLILLLPILVRRMQAGSLAPHISAHEASRIGWKEVMQGEVEHSLRCLRHPEGCTAFDVLRWSTSEYLGERAARLMSISTPAVFLKAALSCATSLSLRVWLLRRHAPFGVPPSSGSPLAMHSILVELACVQAGGPMGSLAGLHAQPRSTSKPSGVS